MNLLEFCMWSDADTKRRTVEETIEELQQENKILRENAEHNDKVVDKVNWENQLLKQRINKAIEYINGESPYAGVSGKRIKEILKGTSE